MRIPPFASSLRSFPGDPPSVTQMFAPSKTTPVTAMVNPAVTVVTVHGMEAAGVTIETPAGGPEVAAQRRPPANASPSGKTPTPPQTVVTDPAACEGSIR